MKQAGSGGSNGPSRTGSYPPLTPPVLPHRRGFSRAGPDAAPAYDGRMTTPWIADLRAALDDQGGPPTATLATVGDGPVGEGPVAEARTVVVRDLADDGGLTFTSDARSDKNAQLRANPSATLLFWLAKPKRQFRLLGTVAVLTADDPQRQLQWAKLNDGARALFLWPPPGQPRDPNPAAFPPAVPADVAMPPSFEVLVLTPARAELLDLSQVPHFRQRWSGASGGWMGQTLNP